MTSTSFVATVAPRACGHNVFEEEKICYKYITRFVIRLT